MVSNGSIRLKVASVQQQDVGKGIIRLRAEHIRSLGLERGDVMEIKGKRLLREGSAVVDLRDGESPCQRIAHHDRACSPIPQTGRPHFSVYNPLGFIEPRPRGIGFLAAASARGVSSQVDKIRKDRPTRSLLLPAYPRLLRYDSATAPTLC